MVLVLLATPFIVFMTVLGVVTLQDNMPSPPCPKCGHCIDDDDNKPAADEGTNR